MLILEEYYITIIFDLVAALILFGMCIVPKTGERKGDLGTGIFTGMGICIVAGALVDLGCRVLAGKTYDAGKPLVLILHTLAEFAIIGFMYLFLLYTDYELFGSRDHLRRHFGPYLIPLAVIAAIFIINLFTGVLFTVSDDLILITTNPYYILKIVEYLYLIIPAVHFMIGFFKIEKKNFLHPLSIYIPILCSAVLSVITPFTVTFLGCSVGLVFLVFSRIDSWRFEDIATGFYNRAYFEYILEMLADNKSSFKGMITFDIEGDRRAFSRILKEELPSGSEVVALNNGRFVYLAETGNMIELKLINSLICDGVREYDDSHSDKILFKEAICHSFRDYEAISAAILSLK